MGTSVDIIEIIDSKYILNNEILRSVLSQAEKCQKIALISIIGPKISGKSLLMNCLINYLESSQKNVWPKNSIIEYNTGFKNDDRNPNPVIQMWSKPFILEDESQRTAIFLMDSSNVFTDSSRVSNSKIMEEIIGLFLLTSSTVIYNRVYYFPCQELMIFQDIVEKNLKFVKSVDLFQEIFFCIRDWDSGFRKGEHPFGLKGGKEYLKKESKDLLLHKYLQNSKCYLMPEIGCNFCEPDLVFDKLNNNFNVQLSQMIKMELLNIDEMQIKNKPKTEFPIKANELIELFESYINILNAESNFEINKDLVISMNNLSMNENKMQTTVTIHYKDKHIFETNLDERHSGIIEALDSKKDSAEKVLNYAEICKSKDKVFGDKKEAIQSFGTFPFGVNNNSDSNTSSSLLNQINESENEMEVTHELEDTQKTNESNVSNNIGKDIDMTDVSNETVVSNGTTDCEMAEPNSSENIPHWKQSVNTTFDKKLIQELQSFENSTIFDENLNEITVLELNKYCDNLLNDFKTTADNAFANPKFDFDRDLSKIHNNKKSQLMSLFDDEFKNKNPQQLIKEHRKQLSVDIDSFRDDLKVKCQTLSKNVCDELEIMLKESVDVYNKEMRSSLEYYFKLNNFKFSLAEIDNRNKKISVKCFDSLVKKINYLNPIKKFNNKLEEALNERKSKYMTILDIIKSYKSEMDQNFKTYRYIPFDNLMKIHFKLIEKSKVSLDKIEDQELKSIVLEVLDSLIDSINKNYEVIGKSEEEVVEEVIDFVYDLFHKRFNNKLRSGLFLPTLVYEMHERLLEHTIETMKTNCDFREHQKDLKDKCVNELKTKVKQNYDNISTEYSRKVVNARKILLEGKNEAFMKYCTDMRISLSAKPYFKRNEFESISSKISFDAIKVNEKLLQCFKYDFNFECYNALVSENTTEINKKIKIQREIFEKENDKNAPKVSTIAIYFGRQYLLAANYEKEFQFILDKNKQKMRPNSIAFSDEILFGYEAKEYNEKLLSDKDDSINRNFDIKELIGKNRKELTNESLNSYPFEFLSDKMKVKVENSIAKNDLSIESLIALQILSIKLDAEKQIGNNVANVVLTLPTHYNLRQKNAFKDAAKIAGLENVEVLSEISAAAISYASDLKRIENKYTNNVFILSVNELECDAAVCQINDSKILFKSCYHQNLASHLQRDFLKELKKDLMILFKLAKEKTQNEKFMKVYKSLLDKTLSTALTEKKFINSIVIVGSSILMNLVKDWTVDYFGKSSFYLCHPLDVIINGSAIFAQEMYKSKSFYLDISEVTFYPIHYKFEGKNLSRDYKDLALGSNKRLPDNITKKFYSPRISNLPLKISVFQDSTLVSLFYITSIPNTDHFWFDHLIKFDLNNFGELHLSSNLVTYDNKKSIGLNLIEIKLGLKEEEIAYEEKIVASIEQKLKEKDEAMEKKLTINQSIEDLEKYYFEIKKSVDNNSALRGLKKKRIIAELEETLKVIQSNSCDLKSIVNQKLKLEETVSCLKL